MTVTHDSFTLTRALKAPPSRAFAAWSDIDQKRKWFVDNDGMDWETVHYTLDFRIGGTERGLWRMVKEDDAMAGDHANETTYLMIVPDALIVFAHTMALNGRIHSASLASVDFQPDGAGTRLTYSEQMTIPEGGDTIASRRGGMDWLLGHMADQVENA